MKIEISNIEIGDYDVRDEVDDGHVETIAESLEEDGQWNPVIVRPAENGSYEMIAGHTRLRAAKQLGWEEIEGTVENVDDEEANKLALKTNLKRKGMSKLEEGKVVNKMMNQHGFTQSDIAEKLGKSPTWVRDRVRVALDLSPEVKGLVEEGELTYNLARIVTRCPDEKQLEFAKLLIDQEITSGTKATELLRRYENDTLVTVGYEGRDFEEFVSLLEDERVDVLVDVRGNASSNYKPEFNGDVLADRLQNHDIEYRHEPELGVKQLLREPYKEDAIGHECFEDWYRWWVTEQADVDLLKFARELEHTGTPALMCIEEYATPTGGQEIFCHRHHLAEMIQPLEFEGRTLFPNRRDVE